MPITGHSLESTPAFAEMTARRGAGRGLSQGCPPIVASHNLSRPKPRAATWRKPNDSGLTVKHPAPDPRWVLQTRVNRKLTLRS